MASAAGSAVDRMRGGYEAIFNEGRLDVVDDMLGDAACDNSHGVPPLRGEAFRAHLKGVAVKLRTAFPDLHYAVEAAVQDGDTVVVRILMTGTHRAVLDMGPFKAIAPTGRAVAVRQIHWNRLDAAGRGAEHWAVIDFMGLMQQLTRTDAERAARAADSPA